MPSLFPKGLPTAEQLAELDTPAPPPPKRPSEGFRRTAATTSTFAKETSAPPARKRPAGQGQTGSSSNSEPAEAMAGLAAAGSARELDSEPADAPVDWKQKCEEWKQKYKEEVGKNEDYHNHIAEREENNDRLSNENDELRDKNRKLENKVLNAESNLASCQDELQKRINKLIDLSKQYDQRCKELASKKAEVEGLTQANDNLSKTINAHVANLQTKTNEADDRATDLALALKEIDNLKAENEYLEAAKEENDDARKYVDIINQRLESVFTDTNNPLTPENFGNQLDRLMEQKELDHQSSEPSLNEQFKEKQSTVKNKGAQRARQPSLAEEVSKAANKDARDSRTSDSLDVLTAGQNNADLNARIEELERENARIEELEQECARVERKSDRLSAQKRNGETTIEKQAKKITDLETEKQRLIKSNREIQEQLSNPAETESRIKHVIHTQDATVWQAFCNASIWQKLLVTVLFLVCFTVTLSGYHERKMWLEANSFARHSVQYANSAPAPFMMGFSSWLEDLLGVDLRLLG